MISNMLAVSVGMGLELGFSMILTIATIIAFTILVCRKPIIQIFHDGIYFKDFLYPTAIPNDSIKSIKLVHVIWLFRIRQSRIVKLYFSISSH